MRTCPARLHRRQLDAAAWTGPRYSGSEIVALRQGGAAPLAESGSPISDIMTAVGALHDDLPAAADLLRFGGSGCRPKLAPMPRQVYGAIPSERL